MQIKKKLAEFTVVFNLNRYNDTIDMFEILESIIMSFQNTILLDKNIKPEKLMELNQSGKRTLLTDSEVKPYDTIRILTKLISNFFIYTNQVQDFTLEHIEVELDEETSIIIYGSEIYQGDLRKITFTPTIRSKWRNPQVINNLIEMS